jgi:hypothetical protein
MQTVEMLRPKPTDITLTLTDISQSTERIAAQHRAIGKARICQGAERSRDKAIRTLGCTLPLRPAMTAVVSDSSDLEPIGFVEAPKTFLSAAGRRARSRRGVEFNISTGSGGAGSSKAARHIITHQHIPSPSGPVLHSVSEASLGAGNGASQLHLDGQADHASGSLSFPIQHRTAILLSAPATMNRQRADIPRSPLHQSHIMSSPNVSSSVRSPQSHYWASRRVRYASQLSDGSIGHQLSGEGK